MFLLIPAPGASGSRRMDFVAPDVGSVEDGVELWPPGLGQAGARVERAGHREGWKEPRLDRSCPSAQGP